MFEPSKAHACNDVVHCQAAVHFEMTIVQAKVLTMGNDYIYYTEQRYLGSMKQYDPKSAHSGCGGWLVLKRVPPSTLRRR